MSGNMITIHPAVITPPTELAFNNQNSPYRNFLP